MRLQIAAMALGGEGVARADIGGRSRAVFVPASAPGDEIEAEVRLGGAAPRATILRLLLPSPDRVVPPCPFADRCGGCDWMHMSLDAQRRHRQALVVQALSRALPELRDVDVGVHLAQRTDRYRTRIRLGVRTQRGRVIAGFRGARSHELVEPGACMVAGEPVERARLQAGAWLQGSGGSGELTIACGSTDRASLFLRWSGELAPSVFAAASQRVDAGHWAGVEISIEGSKRPAVIGDATCAVVAADGGALRTPAGGFMQAHDEISRELAALVAGGVPQGARTLELFCGAGNLTVALARRTAGLEAVEGDARAVEAARANLAVRGLGAKVSCADANGWEVGSDVRVVVLDPPRSGAAGACRRVAASRARRVVMVSCDPATLARDLGLLVRASGRWRVLSVDLFEMFPHTSHAETVVVLDREAGSRSAA